MRRLFCIFTLIFPLFAIAQPALAAALGPGRYSAPNPNITYTNITGIGYHDSGDPIYYFDSASWSVVGADQLRVEKNVWGGGGTLCMDGSVCQSFDYYTTGISMNLPDRGVHTFTMTNGAITFLKVVYDGTPPVTTASASGTLGSGGWYRSPVAVSLSATDSPGAFPSIIVSGVANSTANGSPYTGPVTFNAEGFNTFTYFSTDNKGNVEATKSLALNIDTQPPVTTASLAGALGDNGWYTSDVTVTLNGADTGSGVASTVFDGAPYSGPVSLTTQGTTSHTFASSDVAGNVEAAQTTAVNIDTELPTGSLTSHTSGQIVRGAITLSGAASDTTSGIARVQVSPDNGATWIDATVSGSAWSYPFDTTTIGDGAQTLQARVRDLAGNEQTFAALDLTVDNTPPVVSLTSPDTDLCIGCGLDNTVTLTYATSDATTGVTNWALAVDGGPTLTSGSGDANSAFTWDGSALPTGAHTLRFTATDAAGNVQDGTLTVTLYAPSRSVMGQPIVFPITALTGATQVVDAAAPTAPWTVFNSFPAGTGWHVQIAAADFVAGTRVIPANNIAVRIQPTSLAGQAGASSAPATLVADFTPLANTPQTILSAVGSDGIGAYDFTPEFRLTVPADAYAGDYTAIITLTIIAGP